MAGDWIKFEHATADKPEVLRIAELLDISRREAVGLLIDFWIWLDRNCHADVTLMSRRSLEDVTHVVGFSACLVEVGWATFDEKTGLMTISHFYRHNGNSAKTRALANDRQSRKRHANVTPNALPEKRREELSTNVDKARSPKRLQEPTPDHIALAQSLGVSCQTEFLKYHDHLAANGKAHSDEGAGFRNWLRKAADFKPDGKQEPLLQASHKPAKIPELPHTDMPDAARTALAAFKGRH